MRPGGIGRPSNIPDPSSSVLDQALRLIAGLGGGDRDTKAMLQEMRDVQLKNESFVEEAKSYVNEISKREAALKVREDALAKKEAEVEALAIKNANDIAKIRSQVEQENLKLTEQSEANRMKYAEQMSEIRDSDSLLRVREEKLDVGEKEYKSRLMALEGREMEYSRKRTVIENIAKNIQLELRDL